MAPLLLAMLRFGLGSRRGRRLLMLGALGAFRLAKSPPARQAYGRAWRIASHRPSARGAVRSAARRVRR